MNKNKKSLNLADCIAPFYRSVRNSYSGSYSKLLLLIISIVLVSGCATAPPRDTGTSFDKVDPYEKVNRKSYAFTDWLDRKIMEPVADAYIGYIPVRIQRSVSHFYDNLSYPNVVLNVFLQGKMRQGFQDSARFLVNSTAGIAGLFDIASPLGLPQHDEDFGQTLGVWGVDANTYVFIPFLGPSSNRDIAGIPVKALTNVMFYSFLFGVDLPVTVPLGILDAIDTRARLSGPMKIRDEAAVEPYLFVRDAYLQQRKHLIYDGNMPPEAYEDLTEEEPPAREEPPKKEIPKKEPPAK
jgi:phospholipid-binding lipoprotein MlaA